MNWLTSACVNTVPQLPAHNSGINVIPVIICTHCSPHSTDTDLHPASTLHWSINQTNCSISATMDSYIYVGRNVYLNQARTWCCEAEESKVHCEGAGGCLIVAEHLLHKTSVLSSIPSSCWPFTQTCCRERSTKPFSQAMYEAQCMHVYLVLIYKCV